jgi:peptidoglycan/LPS O-acetylase OafA/YrhL
MEGVHPDLADLPMHHGYLAVDFFFLLSGFVVGYAYDDRWGKMSIKEFFKIRLVRLHPMVLLGVLIGTIVFIFDSYTNGFQTVSLLKLLGVVLISFTLLPSPDLRGWNETHSLDGPCWSLLQEYIANVIYALFGRKMSKLVLIVIVALSAVALVYAAMFHGNLGTGWGYDTFWIGFSRMMFPFFAGLLLFRTGKLIRIPKAYTVCSLLLAAVFFMPWFKLNGPYDAAAVIFVFPIIVAAGAGGTVKGRWAKICKFSGDISYPLYITHYPFIYMYGAWIAIKKPALIQILPVAGFLFVFFILLAYASLKWYDEPVRNWLKKNYLSKKEGSKLAAVTALK